MDGLDSNAASADIDEIMQIVKERMVRLYLNAWCLHVWFSFPCFVNTRTVQSVNGG